jgi:hypothetical protein
MKLTIEITDEHGAALTRRASDTETVEGIASAILASRCEQFVVIDRQDELEALASNERLMALGRAVASQPEKLSAVEKAVMQILS